MHENFSVPRSEQACEKCPIHYASIADVKSRNSLNFKSPVFPSTLRLCTRFGNIYDLNIRINISVCYN